MILDKYYNYISKSDSWNTSHLQFTKTKIKDGNRIPMFLKNTLKEKKNIIKYGPAYNLFVGHCHGSLVKVFQ